MSIKIVAVIADTHIGSTMGLLPENFTTLEGNEIKLNPIQQWLGACWKDSMGWLDEIAGQDEIAVVSNGDTIEGNHHRTTQIISPEVQDQVTAAMKFLQPLRDRASKMFFVRGTECHTGNREVSIATALKGEIDPATGLRAFDRLPIDIGGIRTVFRHHVSTAIRPWLEATALSIHLAEEQLEAIRNGEPAPRIICGAHRHRHGFYSNGREACIISPPWQALTRHGHKVVSAARTKPGMFILDWRDTKEGELPKVHQRLYDAPAPKAISL
jgi:hypothetical protein